MGGGFVDMSRSSNRNSNNNGDGRQRKRTRHQRHKGTNNVEPMLLKSSQHAALLAVLDAIGCDNCERFPNNATACPLSAFWLGCTGEDVTLLDFDTTRVGAQGRLSTRIGELTALTKLSIRYTRLVGDLFPAQLSHLERLRILYVPGNTQIAEQGLPTWLSRLSLLEELDVSDCRLVGPVPALPSGITDCVLQASDDDGNCLNCSSVALPVCSAGCAIQSRVCPMLAPATMPPVPTAVVTTAAGANATMAAAAGSAPVALIVGVVVGIIVAIALVAAGFVWGRNRVLAKGEARGHDARSAAKEESGASDTTYSAVVLPPEARPSEYEEGRVEASSSGSDLPSVELPRT